MTQRDTGRSHESGFADRLWARTEPLHRQAERSGIFQALLRGQASPRAYALLLRNLLPVYEALERGLDRRAGSAIVGPLARPEVFRASALRADLAHLDGAALPLLGSGQRYAERIDEAARNGGALLVAHAYVRYLGDLNGGQILKRLLGRHLGLGPGSLAFYDFPCADASVLAADYRVAIDAVGAAIDPVEPVIEEACSAFRLTIALSEEVCSEALRMGLLVPSV
ncbi:MAG TPA: biliverdin-producing heme oxygenase [Lichenihabitans sp.]|nr:biliverdin-producing heme oxygenase [Lichenihabitans sp.]